MSRMNELFRILTDRKSKEERDGSMDWFFVNFARFGAVLSILVAVGCILKIFNVI